jgi:hypothetical protein
MTMSDPEKKTDAELALGQFNLHLKLRQFDLAERLAHEVVWAMERQLREAKRDEQENPDSLTNLMRRLQAVSAKEGSPS